MQPALLITGYCVLIIIASLTGGRLPSLIRLTHTRVQLMMSAVGGLMLGIGLFHLLPHAVGNGVSLDRAIWWLMVGLLATFFLIRVFHAHQHNPPDESEPTHEHGHSQGSDHSGAAHAAADEHQHPSGSTYRWIGIALGLSLHTLLDGAALAASVMHDRMHTPTMVLAGFAVFVGVFLHKPLDSLSITTLMATGGWTFRSQQIVNFCYAMMCPLGAVLFFVGVHRSANETVIVGCALAFAAGIFVCIALSDLLPELHFHSHDRIKLTIALLLGVGLAYGIGFLEPPHVHSKSTQPPGSEKHDRGREHHEQEERGHEHQVHDH